ncbi:MAG TPA: lysylphosphatidylglycerol synthase transmembrane domain-containing protein [Polyangiaceae bacterium]|nr:lysylphosphatidylglycerol synthase transmembrane domain-containing protein [Polyangiaceae bacterium]
MRASPREFVKRHVRALAASVALMVGFIWVLRAGALPLLPPRGTLDNVDMRGVALAALLLLSNVLLRFARYHFLIAPIAPISMRRIMTISSIGLGLLTFLPFRLGEFARPAMLRQKGKLSGWAITGTVGAERIIDGVLVSSVLLAGLAFAIPHEPLPERIGNLPVPAALVPHAARFAATLFGGAFLFMALFFYWRQGARRLTERFVGIVSKRLATRLADAVERLSDGFRFLPKVRNTGPFLLITLLAFAAHVCALQLLARSVGLTELSFAEAAVVFGVLGLGFAMPNAPGFFGTIQLALYAGLAVYISPTRVVNQGAAFVFLFYVIYLALVVLITTSGLLAEYVFPAEESVQVRASVSPQSVEKP